MFNDEDTTAAAPVEPTTDTDMATEDAAPMATEPEAAPAAEETTPEAPAQA